MQPLSLRVCRTNLERFALPLVHWETQGHAIECMDCLAQCGDCEAGPFVEAENSFLFADDLPELLSRLNELGTTPQGR